MKGGETMNSALANTLQATYQNTIANNHDILINLTYDKSIIGILVVCAFILITACVLLTVYLLKSKSKKVQDEQHKKELEDKVDELKDGIKHREALMATTNDESVRKMLRMQNDSDDLTIKDILHKIDTISHH